MMPAGFGAFIFGIIVKLSALPLFGQYACLHRNRHLRTFIAMEAGSGRCRKTGMINSITLLISSWVLLWVNDQPGTPWLSPRLVDPLELAIGRARSRPPPRSADHHQVGRADVADSGWPEFVALISGLGLPSSRITVGIQLRLVHDLEIQTSDQSYLAPTSSIYRLQLQRRTVAGRCREWRRRLAPCTTSRATWNSSST